MVRSNGSVYQHGKHNDRVYLIKLGREDHRAPLRLDRLAKREGYGKIVAKVPEGKVEGFLRRGYCIEAFVPKMYRGDEDCLFLTKYIGERRRTPVTVERKVLRNAMKKWRGRRDTGREDDYETVICESMDASEMATLYGSVFSSYPTPIDHEEHLRMAMEDTIYRAVLHDGRMVAIAAAEMDRDGMYAEMTDMATLPDHRGKGLSNTLIQDLEKDMASKGMKTLFSIARAMSYGVNAVFARNGYSHSGRLFSNTNIAGSIETMNVWHKNIDEHRPPCPSTTCSGRP